MTPDSAAATDVARRLWARAAGTTTAPEELAAAAERLCIQLDAGLGRWIGAQGYRALLARAQGVARAEHPALGGTPCGGGAERETADAVRTHGANEFADGLVALVAAVIVLLGRIIGEEMAVRLVEQTGVPGPRGVVSTVSSGGRDG